MATYGEGEPTDNASKFYSYITNENKSLPSSTFAQLNYAVFGLGNRQYEHFNRMGKTTHAHLAALGGNCVFPYGEGDDNECIEDDYSSWRSALWIELRKKYHPEAKLTTEIPIQLSKEEEESEERRVLREAEEEGGSLDLAFGIRYVNSQNVKPTLLPIPSSPSSSSSSFQMSSSTKHFFTASEVKVIVNRELRTFPKSFPNSTPPISYGSTRHIELSLEGTGMNYLTADNLAVLPENDDEIVEIFCKTLGFECNQMIVMEAPPTTPDGLTGSLDSKSNGNIASSVAFKHVFPTPCTIRDVFTKYYDLQVL